MKSIRKLLFFILLFVAAMSYCDYKDRGLQINPIDGTKEFTK